MDEEHFEYDVALSFACECLPFVQEFASELTSRNVRVFFDDYQPGLGASKSWPPPTVNYRR